jgi:hypothetical protein
LTIGRGRLCGRWKLDETQQDSLFTNLLESGTIMDL